MYEQVYVVGGDVIIQEGNLKFFDSFPELILVGITVSGKLKKKVSIVTTMGKVVQLTWDNVTIAPWHGNEVTQIQIEAK
jgi:hypothetical protein